MKTGLAGCDAILTGTGWAGDAFRPETAFKVNAGRLFVGEHLEQFEGADGRTAHDDFSSELVGYRFMAAILIDSDHNNAFGGDSVSRIGFAEKTPTTQGTATLVIRTAEAHA